MIQYQYNKEKIRANPLNRMSAAHVPEIVRNAQRDYDKALTKLEKAKENGLAKKIEEAQQSADQAKDILDERQQKLRLYTELFPDLF